MKRTQSKPTKSNAMLLCAIALMAGKAIAGVLNLQLMHNRISSRFG